MIASWPCPAPDGGTAEEYAVRFDAGRSRRLLVVPALFDEANRMRRLTVEVMRRLDRAGIDCFLPDLPGCNESVQPLREMTIGHWRAAMAAAADHFRAGHVLAVRGGALVAPDLPGWHYAPISGAAILRQMIRVRILASREAGREETQAGLMAQGLSDGLDLAGYQIGPRMLAELQAAAPTARSAQGIAQSDIGGGGLWLRAEPDEDAGQADALAARVAVALQR